MNIAAALPALLLVVIPIYSQHNCQKETDKTYYFIYNASVELKAYYCSHSEDEDSTCKYSNNGKLYEEKDFSSGVPSNCGNNLVGKAIKFFKWNRLRSKFCELSVRVNLLGNTVKFSDNLLCLYRKKKCYNVHISKDVFWNVRDTCNSLVLIANGNFSSWINAQHQTKFISDNITSLILREEIKLCGYKMWKTNYDGIIASKNYHSIEKRNAKYPNLPSNFDEFCDNQHSTADTSTSITIRKMWYVYEYPPNVTITMCFKNLTDTCENVNMTKTAPKNTLDLQTQCLKNFCKNSSCNYKSETVICQTTTQVDLEKDLLSGLPTCKYSDGLCEPFQAFWEYTNRCKDIRKAYEGYEQLCEDARCVNGRNNSTVLFLLRQGSLCGQTVWYTDQNGLVASETELQLSASAIDEDLDLLVSQQSERISKLRKSLFCAMLIVLFCVLWYIFNVIVNLLSLKKLNKTQERKKIVPLINCVSQGLTTHYLCLSHEENKKVANVSDVKVSELYVSVNNELYNKPL